MNTSTKLNLGVACAALGLALATPALAQSAPAADQATAGEPKEEIIVTGSAIKRINKETASPLTFIDSKQLASTGYDNLSTVLSNLTSNGAGTLSNSNSEAFAGGAAGIALRGLSVGATLVLVDGHRLAPYPLSDDGERQFTDVQSIPLFAVDHVEVLKDGASAIYGSDAIAGVVNIILKKQITGAEAQFEAGNSQHGGGATRQVAFALGHGDLSRDGYNMYLTAEFHDQDQILLSQRYGYAQWANLNFSPYGGIDYRPGAPNFLNANQPNTLTPYLVNPNGSFNFVNSGCNTAALAAAGCTYTSPQKLLSPTRNVNLLFGFTKDFGSGWEVKFKGSFFDSEGQQVGSGYNTFPGASYAGQVSNPLNGLPVPGIGAIASYTLPANYLGLGNAAGAYLQGVIPNVGLSTIDIDSQTWRAALDVTGSIAGWDVSGALGFSEVVTRERFSNFVNYTSLYSALTTLDGSGNPQFNPAGGNSAAAVAAIAPTFNNRATDKLYYAQVNGSKKIATLPGGDLAVALGASVVHKDLNNPGAAPVLSGAIGGTFSTYAIGKETDVAEYLEVSARFLNNFELSGALRDDWYDTYGNSLTPKAGLTWKAQPWLLLRGTFSKGFRAPAPAEFGQSQTLFGLGGFQDQVLCPNGQNGPFPVGTVPAACSEQIGFAQTTTKNLRPEKSTSFTAGTVIEPIKNWSTTFDYYHIKINNQIVSASELPTYSYSGSNCLRGPDIPIAGVSDGNGNLVTATPIAGPLAACFAGYVNAQSTTTSGLDINSEYKFKWGEATIRLRADWTHTFNYDLTGPNGITYKLVGTHGPSGVSGDTGNPQDRVNASISGEVGKFSWTVSGYWISGFSITDPSASGGAQATCAGAFNAAYVMAGASVSPVNQDFCRIHSFTSVNLVAGYQFTPKIKLSFDMDNVLDARAPTDVETYGGSFIPVNPAMHMDGIIGRYFRLQLNVKY